MYKVLVTKEAYNDIDETVDYIANILKNPIAAGNLLTEIEKNYSILASNPLAFALCNDESLKKKGYRKIIVKNYIIFYSVNEDEKVVYILRIIYGRRNYIDLI